MSAAANVGDAPEIKPKNGPTVVYVPDASRAVSVASGLLSDEGARKFIEDLKAEYERVREQHANKKQTPLISLEEARANKEKIEWAKETIAKPKFIGRRVFRSIS